jgi:hypothetical protein
MLKTASKSSAATVIEHAIRTFPTLPAISQSTKCRADRFAQGSEPSLSELLADPVLERLMARDRVKMEDLLTLIAEVKMSLSRR